MLRLSVNMTSVQVRILLRRYTTGAGCWKGRQAPQGVLGDTQILPADCASRRAAYRGVSPMLVDAGSNPAPAASYPPLRGRLMARPTFSVSREALNAEAARQSPHHRSLAVGYSARDLSS